MVRRERHRVPEEGEPVPVCDDAVAHQHLYRDVVVVLYVHRVRFPFRVIVNGHVYDLEPGSRVVPVAYHQAGPGGRAPHPVTRPIYEGVLQPAAASPQLDPVTGVIGDNTFVYVRVGGLGVQAVAPVVLSRRGDDLNRPQ